MTHFIYTLFISVLLIANTACHHTDDINTLIVGTISGPETELVKTAQHDAEARFGLHVKVVAFSDYNLPNQALSDGSLDVNVYQHLAYLEAYNAAHGTHLTAVGKTFLYPMGLYSQHLKSIADFPTHAVVALPNDPSNEARALKLLETTHLISLNASATPNLHDITNNPHAIQFKALDAAQLPRILPDVDAALINTNFAIPAGLNPEQDALIHETKDSPYANLIVINPNTQKQKQVQQFISALHSDAVKQNARALFKNAAIPAW